MSRIAKLIFLPFKWVAKTFHIFRLILSNLIFLSIIFVAIFIVTSEDSYEVAPNSILKISIEGNVVEERSIPSSIAALAGNYLGEEQKTETLIQDITRAIDEAKDDSNIKLIVLDTSKMGNVGLDHLRLIGEKINTFQEFGKKVLCLQDTYLQKQYYLASYADVIALNPMGFVALTGFAQHKLYFKDLIDSLRVDYNVFVVGQYKSALEPFTRTSMSSEDREQTREWMDSLWNTVSQDITKERNLEEKALYNYTHKAPALLQKAQGSTAVLAKENGLVDHIFTRQEMKSFLKKESDHSTSIVSLSNYLLSLEDNSPKSTNHIAVIVAEGNIVPGIQPPGTIGAESVVSAIRRAKKDENVKGLVLRINSGGGSAFASEIIRQELLEFQESGKPYYVSMGRLAASGAYWVSADADQIWASPTTITGSIGIFGAIPTFNRALASAGVFSDGESTSPVAGASNLTRGLSSDATSLMQQSIEYGYAQFIDIVAKGRGLDHKTVEKVAGGRVYSGIKAQEIRLVDKIGNLEDTANALAESLQLDEYTLVYIEKSTDMRQQLLRAFTTSILYKDIQSITGIRVDTLDSLLQSTSIFRTTPDPNGAYAYGGEYLF